MTTTTPLYQRLDAIEGGEESVQLARLGQKMLQTAYYTLPEDEANTREEFRLAVLAFEEALGLPGHEDDLSQHPNVSSTDSLYLAIAEAAGGDDEATDAA